METTDVLIVGAGISGLATANFLPAGTDWQLLEALDEPGGWCKTVHHEGFVWDYSGHFFHFRDPEMKAWVTEKLEASGQDVLTVHKRSGILFAGQRVEFPFQKNIHQLPLDDFLECLHDLYFREGDPDAAESFEAMLYAKLGRGITEKFLKPYNEKLYACPLSALDKDAMGRFFPHADIADIIRNMREPDNSSYNATFTYPRGGAVSYVHALIDALGDEARQRIRYGTRLERIDLQARVAHTNRGPIRFRRLVSSAPLNRLLEASALPWDHTAYTWNKVLCFNLGFDRKGQDHDHWLYIPERDKVFYRVGFYDNIFGDDRMSLYVEIGLPADDPTTLPPLGILGDAADQHRAPRLDEVLDGLRALGIVDDHQLVAWHSVVLDPAYVHVNKAIREDVPRQRAALAQHGVYSIGRYGGWTYCSIEDNMLEARRLCASADFQTID